MAQHGLSERQLCDLLRAQLHHNRHLQDMLLASLDERERLSTQSRPQTSTASSVQSSGPYHAFREPCGELELGDDCSPISNMDGGTANMSQLSVDRISAITTASPCLRSADVAFNASHFHRKVVKPYSTTGSDTETTAPRSHEPIRAQTDRRMIIFKPYTLGQTIRIGSNMARKRPSKDSIPSSSGSSSENIVSLSASLPPPARPNENKRITAATRAEAKKIKKLIDDNFKKMLEYPSTATLHSRYQTAHDANRVFCDIMRVQDYLTNHKLAITHISDIKRASRHGTKLMITSTPEKALAYLWRQETKLSKLQLQTAGK